MTPVSCHHHLLAINTAAIIDRHPLRSSRPTAILRAATGGLKKRKTTALLDQQGSASPPRRPLSLSSTASPFESRRPRSSFYFSGPSSSCFIPAWTRMNVDWKRALLNKPICQQRLVLFISFSPLRRLVSTDFRHLRSRPLQLKTISNLTVGTVQVAQSGKGFARLPSPTLITHHLSARAAVSSFHRLVVSIHQSTSPPDVDCPSRPWFAAAQRRMTVTD